LLISTQVVSLFGNSNRNLSPKVPFLQEEPLIDGVLDKKLNEIPFRKFDSKFNIHFLKGSLNSQYKIAYGTKFLYLFIEAEADSFICRDRGYQNGDGFILQIAKPQPDNKPTDEFYVFGFSAQKDKKQMWAEKVLWYYNIDVKLSKLDNNVKLKYTAKSGKIAFELLLPWSEVYPYHPWISENIGINLWFVKAFEGKSFPNMQGIVWDMKIGAEQSLRKYIRLQFASPKINNGSQAYAVALKNHISLKQSIQIKVVSISSAANNSEVLIKLKAGTDTIISENKYKIQLKQGLTTRAINISTDDLQAGDYIIEWSMNNGKSHGKILITLMDKFDYRKQQAQLEKMRDKLSSGTYSTMLFYLNDYNYRKTGLFDYETCPELNKEINEFMLIMNELKAGNDTLI